MTMTHIDIPVEDNNTLQRCPHDQENPYAIVSRAAIRDETISPESRWLIMYLLSMKDGWKINTHQLLNHVKPHMGRMRFYKMLNECMEAGYIKREEIKVVMRRPDGSYKGCLKRVRYYVSETPKFKKCFQNAGFRHPEARRAEDRHDKDIACEDIPSKEEHILESIGLCGNVRNSTHYPRKTDPPELVSGSDNACYVINPEPVSDCNKGTCDKVDSIPSNEGTFSIDSIGQSTELEELLNFEDVYSKFFRPHIVARWIEKFGIAIVLATMKYFFQVQERQKKKPIDNPESWMEKALKDNFLVVNANADKNKAFAENLKCKYNLRRLKINKRYCQDTATGRDFYYHLPPETFCAALQQLLE